MDSQPKTEGTSGERDLHVEDRPSTSIAAPQGAGTTILTGSESEVPQEVQPLCEDKRPLRTEKNGEISVDVPTSLILTKSGRNSMRESVPWPSSQPKKQTSENIVQVAIPKVAQGVEVEPSSSGPLSSRTSIISLSEKRTASMPVAALLDTSLECPEPSSTQGVASNAAQRNGVEMKNIARSVSLPLNKLPFPPLRKVGPNSGATVLVKPIAIRNGGSSGDESSTIREESDTTNTDLEKGEKDEKDSHEEIPEEEAVCRICFEELSEKYGETFKMECSCRGEMALAHQECALKWFSIKGNRNCDVCGVEVCNLPVTVIRQNQPANRPGNQMIETHARVWQDVPVLVMLSMLVYFCFLEQLFVGQLGSGALALSLPFACVLGLLAAITASNLVPKRYVWLYATVQLALVICFAHIFYDVVHVESVLSILLSAFVGFGVAMVTSTLLIEYANWKRRAAARAQRERDGEGSAPAPEVGEQTGEQGDHVVRPGDGNVASDVECPPACPTSGDHLHASPPHSHGPPASATGASMVPVEITTVER